MDHSLAWSLQPFPSRSFGPSLLHVPVLVWLSPDVSTKESGTHISPFLIYRVSVLVWGFSFALLNSSSETGFLVVQAGFILHVWLRITFLHPYPKCWAYSLCAWIVLCPGNQTQGFHILDNLSTGHPNSLSCPTIWFMFKSLWSHARGYAQAPLLVKHTPPPPPQLVTQF